MKNSVPITNECWFNEELHKPVPGTVKDFHKEVINSEYTGINCQC
jgi:hypothetical protein